MFDDLLSAGFIDDDGFITTGKVGCAQCMQCEGEKAQIQSFRSFRHAALHFSGSHHCWGASPVAWPRFVHKCRLGPWNASDITVKMSILIRENAAVGIFAAMPSIL